MKESSVWTQPPSGVQSMMAGKFCLDSVSEWGSVYDGKKVLFELTVSEWGSVYHGREVFQ